VSIMLDDFPKDTKVTTPDLFKHVPNIDPTSYPPGMPDILRRRWQSVLAFVPINYYVSNMVYATVDSSNRITLGGPVQSRPWEWVESIEPRDTVGVEKGYEKPSVTNSSSLSLELFATTGTGERVYNEGDFLQGRLVANVRMQHDTFASENLFEQDWRESRVMSNDTVARLGKDNAPYEDYEGGEAAERSSGKQPHSASPAPSVASWSSARASIASARPSPSGRFALNRDVSADRESAAVKASVAGSMSSRGSKRKASSSGSLPDVEEIPNPTVGLQTRGASKRGRGAKQPATTTGGRGKGKKK